MNMRKFIAWILRLISPNYSSCTKCGMPWNHTKSKTVMYSESSGMFATCQHCWDTSSLEQLLFYYTQVYLNNQSQLNQYNCRWAGEKEPVEMGCTLKHLLECVKKEYNKTRGV